MPVRVEHWDAAWSLLSEAAMRRRLEEQGYGDALDGLTPVLGTLGQAPTPFLDALRERPDVEHLTLTERNREALRAELCARWRRG